MGRTFLFFVILFCCVSGSLIGQIDIQLTDSKNDIVLGISTFIGINLEEENEYLAMNIPVLIREQMRQFPYHFLSTTEEAAYKGLLQTEAIEARRKELSTLYSERDRLFFEGQISEEQEQQFLEKTDELKQEIEYLKEYDFSDFILDPKKELNIYSNESQEELMSMYKISPEEFCTRYTLDLYLYGRIEQIEEYFFVEIHLWNNILKDEVILIEDAASRDNLADLLERILPNFFDAIVGEKWAFVSVSAEPEEADIFIDDIFAGTGNVEKLFIEPGIHNFSASAPGYETDEHGIAVGNHEYPEVALELKPLERDSVFIYSDPREADVYAGSVWIGTTPLTFNLPEENLQRIMVVKDDYSPSYINLSPEKSDSIYIQLSPFDFNTSDYLKKKRDIFYLSAGFFVLSFPLPFFLYSITEDLASGFSIAQQNENIEEMMKKYQASANVYHGYIGSIVLSVSLLINTVFHLADYILASELY